MEIAMDQLAALFQLDVRVIIGLLVWGNLAMSILATGYYRFNHFNFRIGNTLLFGIAKFLQTAAWFLLFYRGILPDLVTDHGLDTPAQTGPSGPSGPSGSSGTVRHGDRS